MKPHRIQVRFVLDVPETFSPGHVVPVFHRWIREGRTDIVLLDVADYRHVHRGPGIVLVGHEADFAVDSAGGTLGFRYTRKRDVAGTLSGAVAQALVAAAAGVRTLLEDLKASPSIVRADAFELTLVDTLHYPNDEASLQQVSETLGQLFAGAGLGAPRTARSASDPRGPLALQVSVAGVTGVRVYEDALAALLQTEALHEAA
ncbi:MAG: hypothetical protein R2834_20245 [Rhodothermales bacterium]